MKIIMENTNAEKIYLVATPERGESLRIIAQHVDGVASCSPKSTFPFASL